MGVEKQGAISWLAAQTRMETMKRGGAAADEREEHSKRSTAKNQRAGALQSKRTKRDGESAAPSSSGASLLTG
jgi:3-oxoacyl-ACP reductase-like protein